MSHPKMRQQQMLEWIRTVIERRLPMPSDAAIAEHFNLPGVESARGLLADLAERKQIFVDWNEPGRPISLDPPARPAFKTPTPMPELGRRDAAVDRTAKKIVGILRRGPRTDAAAVVEAPSPSPSPTAVQIDRPSISTAPAPIRPPIANTAPGKRRQINSKVDGQTYDEMSGIAWERGVAVSALASELLVEALAARSRPAWCKPKLSAAVMAAHREHGGDLGSFIQMLIAAGLDCHREALAAEAS